MAQNDVIVLNQAARLSNKDLDAVQRRGFSVTTRDDAEELGELTPQLTKPILVLHCSDRDSQADFITQVSTNEFACRIPVVAMVKDVSGLESKLNKVFSLAVTLQLPCHSAKLVEALRFIERNYRDSREETAATETEIVELPETSEDLVPATDLFSAIEGLRIDKRNLGGAELPNMLTDRTEGYLDIEAPEHPKTAEAVNDLLERLKPRVRLSLERVNVITMKILAPLPLAPDVIEKAKAASILYAEAFAGQTRTLLRRDYLFRGGTMLRKDICSAVKDSALNVGGELADRDLSQTIAKIGKLIGQEEPAGDDNYSIVASAIVASDLVNRVCFQAPIWNGSAAYRLLRKLRHGKFKNLHPAVVCVLLKLLAEALSSTTANRLLRNKKVEEVAPLLIDQDDIEVDLPALTSGMRLSKPLVTKDGKSLLAEDLVLDQDLILRIWQLSAVKALGKAVIRRMH